MPEPLHYAKAPITEATIDIRVMLPDGVTIAQLEELQQALGEAYPENQKVYTGELFFQLGDEPQAENRQQHTGFRLISADKQKITHIRTDGFTFSLLHPYDRWEPFCEEARSLWNIYRAALMPMRVTRLAVRYINRLDIPFASVELKNYLRTVPEVSGDLPQILLSYFMQLVIPQEEMKAKAVINQALVPPVKPDTTSIILDIDLFREVDIPEDEEGIWNLFEQLREGKNTIFKACLTPEAEALIS